MRRWSGVTILETLFSALLLSFLLIFLLTLVPGAMAAVHSGEHQLRASSIAQSLLDQQVAQPFSSLVAGTDRQLPAQVWDQVSYQPRLEIFQVSDRDVHYLLGLRVSVSWDERGAHRQDVHEVWLSHVTP